MYRATYIVSINFSLNDLLGGRGWWLVKGALVRGPFLLPMIIEHCALNIEHLQKKMFNIQFSILNIPVSYTHLDVYKRQVVTITVQ